MAVVGEGFLTVVESAQLLGVSRSTLWRWIDETRLPAYRLGGRRVLIRREDLGCEFWTADRKLVRAVQEKLPFVRWIGH